MMRLFVLSALRVCFFGIVVATFQSTVAVAASIVHIGDTVTVLVFNHAELSGDRVVNGDGTISVPLAGTINAAGSSPATVAMRVTKSLRKYIPLVSVDVALKSQGTAITVVGWPNSIPDGVIKYVPGQTLASAISAIRSSATSVNTATGVVQTFDPYHSQLDMHKVRVTRDDKTLGVYDTTEFGATRASDPTLEPGDVISFRNRPVAVSVRGAVKQPGIAYLYRSEPLSDVLDQVGGVTDDASASDLVLTRNGMTSRITVADSTYHQPAIDGDTLTINTAPQVLVSGDVLKPGTTQLKNDSSLLSAVSNAGGPDKDSDLSHIKVIRGSQVTQYDVTAVAKGDFAANPQLQNGDEVIVGRGHRVDALEVLSTLTGLTYTILRF
jgi:protein involved in polysaccharide export with SLBB domain